MPKFHGGDYVASREMEEEELSDEIDMDADALFDSDNENEEEAMRSDIKERQNLAKMRMEREAADELRVFQEQLLEEKRKKVEAAILESNRLSRENKEARSSEARRSKVVQEEEEVEKKNGQDLDLDDAMDSEEERALNEHNDHLEYIEKVRFDQEFKFQKEDEDKAEALHQKKQAEELSQKQKQDAEDEINEKTKAEHEEDLARHEQRQQQQQVLQEHEIRKQQREQAQIDLEFYEQSRQQRIRMANVRNRVMRNNLSQCSENRKENVGSRQSSRRQDTVNRRRGCDDNLFMETLEENIARTNGEEIDNGSYESSEDSEFDSDTSLMKGNEEDYASLDENGEIRGNHYGVRL